MTDRTKAIMMVFGLTHQLNAWLEFSRSLGYMTQKFKYSSGILSNQCNKFLHEFEAMDEMVYEHSVQVSEIFERIAKMDEKDIKSLLGLIKKIETRNKNEKILD